MKNLTKVTKVINQTLSHKTYMENPYRNIIIDNENKLVSVSFYLDSHPDSAEQVSYNETFEKAIPSANITGCVDITDDEDNHIRYALFSIA